MARDDRGIEQHPHGNEEEDGEHVREGQDVGGCSVADPRSADDSAREERSRASDTSKISALAKAIPMAVAKTASVNSSREPSPSTRVRTQGSTREPATSIKAVSRTALPSAALISSPVSRSDVVPACWVSVADANTGSSTSATTVNRSSKMSQPMATLLGSESVAPRCRSARSKTTVLATEIASPRTSDERKFQPNHDPAVVPSAVAIAICTTAPGTAMR